MDRSESIWEDAVVVGLDDILDYNEDNILPQHNDTIVQIRSWLQPTDYDGEGSEYQKHLTSHLLGTGNWFLDSDIYQKWHDGDEHGMLWTRGYNTLSRFCWYDLTRFRYSGFGEICTCRECYPQVAS